MGIFIAVLVTAVLVWFIASKMNSGVRHEEYCAEQIQNAFISNGTPIEIGKARLMLRNAIKDLNRINELSGQTVFLSLTTAREIAVNGMLYALETGDDPRESLATFYAKHCDKNKLADKKLPTEIVFKSNAGAFKHACLFMNTSLENSNPVLAIVLAVKSNHRYCVKLSNSDDPTIPLESPEQLLATNNISNICFSAAGLDRVDRLNKGDLVMYVALEELAAIGQGDMAGFIIAKVKPIYSMEHCGWAEA